MSEGSPMAVKANRARSARSVSVARPHLDRVERLARASPSARSAAGSMLTQPWPNTVISAKKLTMPCGRCRMAAAIGISSTRAAARTATAALALALALGRRSRGFRRAAPAAARSRFPSSREIASP